MCGQHADGHQDKEGDTFNCGEEVHSNAESPNPLASFAGACRVCQKNGHLAKDCPDKTPMLCHNCRKIGHTAKDCKDNRVFDLSDVPDVAPEAAWEALITADRATDLDRFREVFVIK